MTQLWQCRVCHSTVVRDEVLAELGGSLQIHRLTCEQCGAVGHYDDDRTHAEHPTTTVNERFWCREGPWHPRGAVPITRQ